MWSTCSCRCSARLERGPYLASFGKDTGNNFVHLANQLEQRKVGQVLQREFPLHRHRHVKPLISSPFSQNQNHKKDKELCVRKSACAFPLFEATQAHIFREVVDEGRPLHASLRKKPYMQFISISKRDPPHPAPNHVHSRWSKRATLSTPHN